MLRTVKATIDRNGTVKLAEAVTLSERRSALVTILDRVPARSGSISESAILAESALKADWLSSEEDEAWKHLTELPGLDKKRNGKKGRK